ncbi:MAG TPA: hypothetical protein VFQ65_18930, partial [Kofleriaceae bacterium]|nr:hypothetical protein [Kofleriaceae bacterium]
MFDSSSISKLTAGDQRPPAVVVAVQLPGVTDVELESSITELERLAKTLGLDPIARVVQRRAKLASGVVLGEGKLVELASWTGGSGEIPKYVRPGSKQADAAAADDDEE